VLQLVLQPASVPDEEEKSLSTPMVFNSNIMTYSITVTAEAAVPIQESDILLLGPQDTLKDAHQQGLPVMDSFDTSTLVHLHPE
jgi:hypothetical protein